MGAVIVFTADPRDAVLVASALGLLERHLRASGSRLPDSLRVPVVHAGAARSRQEPPALGGEVQVPDDADVLLLTYLQTAARLSTSVRTVQRLVSTGELPARRIGRRAYVAPADLEAFVAGLGRPA